MSIDIPEIERIRFFPGQRLTADDLTDLDVTNRELRWLHNRSLHPWGIGIGLEVSGEKGDTVVSVKPGYAVDIKGRELVVTSEHKLPIPAVPGTATGAPMTFYLVARYLADSDQTTLQTRNGVCAPGGSVRLADEPSIEWRTSATLDEGIEIIVGMIRVLNCMLSARVSAAARRYVRALHQPYISGGKTTAGSTNWQPLTISGVIVGQFVHINSSAAGFSRTPQYMISVPGTRVISVSPAQLAFGVIELANADRFGFAVNVMFPDTPGTVFNPPELRHPVQGPKLLNTLGWTISWIGVEG